MVQACTEISQITPLVQASQGSEIDCRFGMPSPFKNPTERARKGKTCRVGPTLRDCPMDWPGSEWSMSDQY